MPEDAVSIRDLYGDDEEVKGSRFSVKLTEIGEVLDTGLFSSQGIHRLGWAHKTYAEYLAAYYLMRHHITPVQVMSLIVHPDDPERKIVPQLHETTAWLSEMRPNLFRELVKRDPNVLIQSAVAVTNEKGRTDFVETLLQLDEEESLLSISRHSLQQYSKLAHPHLEKQLQPYLRDCTQSLPTRLLAIKIAEACRVQSLQDDLATIALDSSQPLAVREDAAHAVVHIGDETTKARFNVLALQDHEDDPNDQLKGYGLQATWPNNHITAVELFSVLTQPKREHFYGAYQTFLLSYTAQYLHEIDLPCALAWTERQQDTELRIPSSNAFNTIRDAIMMQAWEHLGVPEVLQGFTSTVLASLKHYNAFLDAPNTEAFCSRIMLDAQKRHVILEALFSLIARMQRDPTELLMCEPSLLFQKDIDWLLDVLPTIEAKETRRVVAQILWRIVDRDNAEQMYSIFVACETSPELASEFAPLLLPVALDSPQVQHMKEDYRHYQRQQEMRQTRSQHADAPTTERIESLLHECEQTNNTWWLRIVYELTYRLDDSPYGEPWDHKTFPKWNEMNETLKARMIPVATRYVQEQDLNVQQWKDDGFPYSSWVMYKSLQLIWQEVPQLVLAFSVQVWERIAPAFLLWNEPREIAIDYELLKIGYKTAPTEMIASMSILIDIKDKRGEQSDIVQKMEPFWDDRLSTVVLEKVQSEYVVPENREILLRMLLIHRVEKAYTFAASLISVPPPLDQRERATALMAARALITSSRDAGWSVLWTALQEDTSFGLQLLSQGTYEPNLLGMTEDQIADLYIWLVRQHPPSMYPIQLEGFVGAADHLALLRNDLLTHLQHRGTFEACNAIRQIMRELPEQELPYMPWVLREAQDMARRRTWTPPRVEELLQVVRRQEARLVQNGDHLLEVLIESLERLDEKLQRETPAAIDVWNETTDKHTKKKVYTPKDENRFSDYVKRYLEEDLTRRGVIVNREVVLRAGTGASTGERTDIHVDAVIRQPHMSGEEYAVITVIIEVKGCWHKQLKEAMQTQLVDRYLKENSSCQHGLYLVGWFLCEQWDDTADSRKKQSPKKNLHEARKHFDIQAKNLSQPGRQIRAYVMNTALR